VSLSFVAGNQSSGTNMLVDRESSNSKVCEVQQQSASSGTPVGFHVDVSASPLWSRTGPLRSCSLWRETNAISR
jgi:hypothetical protein